MIKLQSEAYLPPNMDNSYQVNTPSVAHECLDGEVVIINLLNGNYYSLESIGVAIWTQIDRGKTLSAIAAIISQQYDCQKVDIIATIASFIAELELEGLISRKSAIAPATDLESIDRLKLLPFTTPKLNRYSDMQELLLLDPIHDVDAIGWPNAKVG